MGRERKARLDKSSGGTTEFTGFSAFALGNDSTFRCNNNATWSPVYMGSDENLQLIFPRISQKRDPVTKVKGLNDLESFLALHVSGQSILLEGTQYTDDRSLRRIQLEALQHWAWIYHHKTHYDNSPLVRAAALQVWEQARRRLPKAFKNLLTSVDPELLGMIFSAQADPITSVQRAAAELVRALQSEPDLSWKQGLVDGYAARMLSYGNAETLDRDLHQQQRGSGKKKGDGGTSTSEVQRDAAEEKYDRLIGTCLDALNLWVRAGDTDSKEKTSIEGMPIWWKSLSSSRTLIRLKAYQLLSTTAVAKTRAMILPANLPNQLSNCLSSEKQAANIPALLEAVVSLLSYQHNRDDTADSTINEMYVKHLQKLLKRACLGSPAGSWAPTLLPLSVLLGKRDVSYPLRLLRSAWEGREIVVGSTAQLVTAIAEGASFALLSPSFLLDSNSGRELAELWLEAFQFFLGIQNPRAKEDSLIGQFASDLSKFQELTIDKCAFVAWTDWFWNKGVAMSIKNAESSALSALLDRVSSVEPPWLFSCRERFHSELAKYESNSGLLPTVESYGLFLQLLKKCGPGNIWLEDEGSGGIQKFVVNDLLQWIILHTSSLSRKQQSDWLTKQDFSLLRLCLIAMKEDRRQSVWNTVSRELVAAKSSTKWITVGLRCLAADSVSLEVASESLSQFATDLARDSSANWQSSCDFFRLCIGLDSCSAFVGRKELAAFVETACQSETPIPILEVLIELMRSNQRRLLGDDEVEEVLVHSWKIGGQLYEDHFISILSSKSTPRDRILSKAALDLTIEQKELEKIPESELDAESVNAWAARACRLLESHRAAAGTSLPLFPIVNGQWTSHTTCTYSCCMALFRLVEAPGERLQLLSESLSEPLSNDLVHIAVQLSQGRLNTQASLVLRESRCCSFFECIGGSSLDPNLLSDLVENVVSQLANYTDCGTESGLRHLARLVSVFEILLNMAYPPPDITPITPLEAAAVKEGDLLWYVVDPLFPEKADAVTVRKVHFSADTGYYFTINFQDPEKSNERQTVLERLRRTETYTGPLAKTDDNARKKRVRERIIETVAHAVRFQERRKAIPLFAEAIHVVGGILSLGESRGVGSPHFEVFSLLSMLNSQVATDFRDDRVQDAETGLWTLALALGFGLNTKPSNWSSSMLKLDLELSSEAILSQYVSMAVGENSSLDKAVLAWIVTTLNHQQDNFAVSSELVSLLFRITEHLLQNAYSLREAELPCKAIALFAGKLSISGSISVPSEMLVALDGMVGVFSRLRGYGVPRETTFTDPLREAFRIIFIVAFQDKSMRVMLAETCKPAVVGGLVQSLFDNDTRTIGFLLLHMATECTSCFNLNKEQPIATSTASLLQNWTEGLDEEEAGEIDEDVHVVAEWLPEQVMGEMEKWNDADFEELDELNMRGQLLVWLITLRVVEHASRESFRLRPAFNSYLSRSGTANHILNLALLCDATAEQLKDNPSLLSFDIIDNMDLSEVARVALFRTIEVFPSLSRRWWESSCPKAFVSSMVKFLETQIGPKMLQRALGSIRSDADRFGAMKVAASTATREVTAEYIQDDFTLRVVIRVPVAFPFVNAEVDCSKTLGIPEKQLSWWKLQIMLMLNNQGGTLQDALLLWRDNVDKQFEGVEPCPICYSVLHVKTHKLPVLQCRTCSNCFHVDCLTQWFRSSGKNQCVLCQKQWQGTRVG